MSTDASIVNMIPDKVLDLLNIPRVAYFLYYGVIMMTGYFILSFLSRDAFPFDRSLLYMGSWLVLIIILEPPKAAKQESEPFANTDIVPKI